MSDTFDMKQIMIKIVRELDEKIEKIRKSRPNEQEKYSKSKFFNDVADNEVEFPISKDTYYCYSAFAKKRKSSKPLQSIDLRKFFDICTYTDISADYLLGFIETKRREQSAGMVRKEFGLSDKSMENLTAIKNRPAGAPGELSSYIINFILENDNFWNELDSLLPTYLAENYLKESSDYVSRVNFELSEAFIHLIDDICKSLLMVAADAEKNGFSIFDNHTKKSYQSIIEEAQKRGWNF